MCYTIQRQHVSTLVTAKTTQYYNNTYSIDCSVSVFKYSTLLLLISYTLELCSLFQLVIFQVTIGITVIGCRLKMMTAWQTAEEMTEKCIQLLPDLWYEL